NMIAFNEFIVQEGGGYSDDWVAEFGNVDYAGTDAQNLWLQGGADRDVISNDSDPETVFRTATPNNGREAKIHGMELAVQHFFGDTGFGVQANYTIVRGDVGFDDLQSPEAGSQFALVGLSDTANLSGIYENDRFQARIAYNWRSEYLNETSRGGFRNPRYIEDYSQIDLNVSYLVTDALTLSRSEEHTSELQSRENLVCRLLLETKKRSLT